MSGPVLAEVDFIDSVADKFCPNFLAFVVPRTQERHDELGPDDNRHRYVKNWYGLAAGGRTERFRERFGKDSGDETAERVLDGWQWRHPLTKGCCGWWWTWRLGGHRNERPRGIHTPTSSFYLLHFFTATCLLFVKERSKKGLIWLLHSDSCRRPLPPVYAKQPTVGNT